MPQKDTLDNLHTPVCFRILSSSFTSVSIFSVSCYSIVSVSVGTSPVLFVLNWLKIDVPVCLSAWPPGMTVPVSLIVLIFNDLKLTVYMERGGGRGLPGARKKEGGKY